MSARTALRRTRQKLTHGLARKFSLFMIVALTVFTGTLTTVNILAEQQIIEQRLRQRAEDAVTMLANFASNYMTDLRLDELRIIVQDMMRRDDVLYAYVLDADGSLIVDGELGSERLL